MGSLGRESQSDGRVMSPPKHAAKLPYWSESWYRRYRHDLALGQRPSPMYYTSYRCLVGTLAALEGPGL